MIKKEQMLLFLFLFKEKLIIVELKIDRYEVDDFCKMYYNKIELMFGGLYE